MKKILLMFVALFAAGLCSAQDGIRFQDLSFAQALEKAGTQNKLVFIDCYTDWCGPCKKLAAEVFPLKEVGDYFNGRFVSLKMDMEKGEGPGLVKRYGVSAYPTMLLIDGEGNIIHKLVGYMGAGELIASLEKGTGGVQMLADARKRYDSGDRSKSFMTGYALTLYESRASDMSEVTDELLALLDYNEKITPEMWYIFESDQLSPVGSANFQYVVDNRNGFRKTVGVKKTDARILMPFFDRFGDIVSGKKTDTTPEEYRSMLTTLESYELEDQTIILYLKLMEALQNDRTERALELCEEYFGIIPIGGIPIAMIHGRVRDKMDEGQLTRWRTLVRTTLGRIGDDKLKEDMGKRFL